MSQQTEQRRPNFRETHIGVSALRTFNSEKLRKFTGILIIHEQAEPIAVMIDYETYLELQELHAALHGDLDGN